MTKINLKIIYIQKTFKQFQIHFLLITIFFLIKLQKYTKIKKKYVYNLKYSVYYVL